MQERLTFKIKPNHNNNLTLTEKVLADYGYYSADEIRNLSYITGDKLKPADFADIYKAVKMILENKNKSYQILVDPDVDGFSSAALTYKMLAGVGVKDIDFILPSGKEHGLSRRADFVTADILVTPDSSVNDLKKLSKLKEHTKILIIDHHEITHFDKLKELLSEDLVVVSNARPDNVEVVSERLTGAGMVFMIAQVLLEQGYLSLDDIKPMLTLTALGQIADASDVASREIRGIVNDGLRLKENKLYQAMTDVNPTIDDLSFSIIPRLNAVSRIGSIEDVELAVKGLAEILPEGTTTVERRRGGKKVELEFTSYELAAEKFKKIKTKQDTVVKKALETIDVLTNKDVFIGVMKDETAKGVSGLIANKMKTMYQMPAFIVKEDGNTYSGSLRCPGEFPLMSWILSTELAFAQGHEQAAGFTINKDNVSAFIEKAKGLDVAQKEYLVDDIIERPTKSVFEPVEKRDVFGGHIQSPVVGFNLRDIPQNYFHAKGPKLGYFLIGNVGFTTFDATNIQDAITHIGGFGTTLDIDILGKPRLGMDGKETVMIEEIAIRKHETIAQNFENYEF